jgi:TM2 domain-containing membrane protein YozV
MKRRPLLAGFLSLLIPGLGQIYGGEGKRGAAILAAAIVIGNLNLLFVLLFVSVDPDPSSAWAYWIPRLGHDLISIWSIAFWIWAIFDAYRLVRYRGENRHESQRSLLSLETGPNRPDGDDRQIR